MASISAEQKLPGPIYVFNLPVRIWHWLHALSITTLIVTGYLIAVPLPSLSGEASDHFLMGNLRFVHFSAAFVFAIGLLVRAYVALVGDKYARGLFIVPVLERHLLETSLARSEVLFLHDTKSQQERWA